MVVAALLATVGFGPGSEEKLRYFVKRATVMTLLRELDPEGVESRKKKRLRRRAYQAKGPNYVWYIDDYDKL